MPEAENSKAEPKNNLTPIRSVLAAVGIYIAAQVIAVSLVAFYAASTGVRNGDFEAWLAASTSAKFVMYLLVALVGIASVGLVLRGLKQGWKTIGLVRPALRDAAYAVGGYLAYLVVYVVSVLILGALIPGLDFEQDQRLDFSTSLTGAALAAAFFSLVILPPLYEEILARGLMYTGLRSRMKFWPAALIASALFAVAHLQWGTTAPLLWAAAVDTFILSLFLVYLREKTGSLWPSIGLHALKNLVAFSLLFVFKIG